MKVESLSEETIKRLRVPAKGNSITYFAGATVQGAKAPRGFGVRVTASGARAFIINYRLRGREHRFTIGAWPDWSALKAVREARNLRQRVDRGRHLQAKPTTNSCDVIPARAASSSMSSRELPRSMRAPLPMRSSNSERPS